MKNRETPIPAEPLTGQKEWQWDGITVLRAQFSLPQLGGTSRRARRFDRYYALIGRTFLARTEKTLFPRAVEECRAAIERSAPWQVSSASLSHRIALQTDDLLSIVLDFCEKGDIPAFRCADVWDTAQMLPRPLSEWFPPHTGLRRAEKRAVPFPFDAPTRVPLRGYYLTEHGLCLPKKGSTVFLPFDSARGPFPPKG